MEDNANDYRSPAASDIHELAVLGSVFDIVASCYCRGSHDIRSGISVSDFARELSRRTQIDWRINRELLRQALNALNDRRLDCILSTCVVSPARMPTANFFKIAVARGLISKGAGAYERIGCWRKQYKLARKVCRELKKNSETAGTPRQNSGSENCAHLSA